MVIENKTVSDSKTAVDSWISRDLVILGSTSIKSKRVLSRWVDGSGSKHFVRTIVSAAKTRSQLR